LRGFDMGDVHAESGHRHNSWPPEIGRESPRQTAV
jgi:hypothetical protein